MSTRGAALRTPSDRPLRVGNCSGFYGDRASAMAEMLDGGPLDVVTGDYLAELTMLILYRGALRDPERGYASTFVRQLSGCLGRLHETGTRVVVNAGGLNPAGCAAAVRAAADAAGLTLPVAYVTGDDVRSRAGWPDGTVTAHAYLGGWPITAALAGGAQVVVTGRCTDAALVTGAAAWWHGWQRTDLDRLAGAVVAGHLLECGAQVTGGNYAFFTELGDDLRHVGFPWAEVAADGSAVIGKHPGTGGRVDVDTVTAQLLYEVAGPRYLGPDVTTHLDTVELRAAGPDRVAVTGTRGSAPPDTLKVATNRIGGYRNAVTVALCGLDIDAKAAVVRAQLAPVLAPIRDVDVQLVRTDQQDAPTEQQATALLRIAVRDPDPALVGRRFSGAVIELALASIPGFHVDAPPADGSPYGVYAPAYLPAAEVPATVHHADGTTVTVDSSYPGPRFLGAGPPADDPAAGPHPEGAPTVSGAPTRRVPLGRVVGARSGDKGGDANIGVWVRSDAAYRWLHRWLDPQRVQLLLPETVGLPVLCHPLPRLRAVNIVVTGLLGEGVAASTRFDPQAKALGEWLRSRLADVPVALLEDR